MRLRELNSMKSVAIPGMALFVAALLLVTGCETKGFLDPGEMMRTTRDPLVWPILDKLNPLDEVEAKFASAEDIKQADLQVSTADYVIGRNDLIQISITEVAGPGMETTKAARVSESGMISLPLIGTIKASGMTEAELEKAISQTYADRGLIRNAQVSVTVLEAQAAPRSASWAWFSAPASTRSCRRISAFSMR
ncbi:MAG: polysaccharide biosynthesis/export family protein [Verrucomicrobiota bacterium]